MKPKEHIHKRLHDINAIQHHENETYILGRDENGDDFTIVFPTFELWEWVNQDDMKESIIKYLNTDR